MKLAELKAVVDAAVERAGDTAQHVSVEVWLGKKGPYDVLSVSQFSVIPDLVICAGVKHEKRK